MWSLFLNRRKFNVLSSTFNNATLYILNIFICALLLSTCYCKILAITGSRMKKYQCQTSYFNSYNSLYLACIGFVLLKFGRDSLLLLWSQILEFWVGFEINFNILGKAQDSSCLGSSHFTPCFSVKDQWAHTSAFLHVFCLFLFSHLTLLGAVVHSVRPGVPPSGFLFSFYCVWNVDSWLFKHSLCEVLVRLCSLFNLLTPHSSWCNYTRVCLSGI